MKAWLEQGLDESYRQRWQGSTVARLVETNIARKDPRTGRQSAIESFNGRLLASESDSKAPRSTGVTLKSDESMGREESERRRRHRRVLVEGRTGGRRAMKRGHREELSRNEHDHWNLEGSLIPHR